MGDRKIKPDTDQDERVSEPEQERVAVVLPSTTVSRPSPRRVLGSHSPGVFSNSQQEEHLFLEYENKESAKEEPVWERRMNVNESSFLDREEGHLAQQPDARLGRRDELPSSSGNDEHEQMIVKAFENLSLQCTWTLQQECDCQEGNARYSGVVEAKNSTEGNVDVEGFPGRYFIILGNVDQTWRGITDQCESIVRSI